MIFYEEGLFGGGEISLGREMLWRKRKKKQVKNEFRRTRQPWKNRFSP